MQEQVKRYKAVHDRHKQLAEMVEGYSEQLRKNMLQNPLSRCGQSRTAVLLKRYSIREQSKK